MKFTKLQGLGNDFILYDALGAMEQVWTEISKKICHRRFGVGSDGLLLLLDSNIADFRMRMFNPDGSEAEACGNGLRCLTRYIVSQSLNLRDTLLIETLGGIRKARLIKSGGKVARIQVSMGEPIFEPQAIPIVAESGRGSIFDIMLGDYPITIADKNLELNFVSMGNPHAVFFTSEPISDFPLSIIGPQVEKYPLFPRGVNFEIANITRQGGCSMRVWERGAGETLACGSGACAVAVAAILRGFVKDNLIIELPGGRAEVRWDRKGEVWLTGPAEIVFTGDWPD